MQEACTSTDVARALEDYECPICLAVLENPVTLSCAHRFCWGCLLSHCATCQGQHLSCDSTCMDSCRNLALNQLPKIASFFELETCVLSDRVSAVSLASKLFKHLGLIPSTPLVHSGNPLLDYQPLRANVNFMQHLLAQLSCRIADQGCVHACRCAIRSSARALQAREAWGEATDCHAGSG